MSQAMEQFRREITAQMKLITKSVNTALDRIMALDQEYSRLVEAESTQTDSNGLAKNISVMKLQVLRTQQQLSHIIFVNFQQQMNESFDSYIKTSFKEIQDDDGHIKIQQVSAKKNSTLQRQLIAFHKKNLMNVCKNFHIAVPRILCFYFPDDQLDHVLTNLGKITSLSQAAHTLGGMVSLHFFPHHTDYIVQIDMVDKESSRKNPCFGLYKSTPVVSVSWLQKSIESKRWLPLRLNGQCFEVLQTLDVSTFPQKLDEKLSRAVLLLDHFPLKNTSAVHRSIDNVTENKENREIHLTDESSTNDEDFTQDSSDYLENALKAFEKQINSHKEPVLQSENRQSDSALLPSKQVKITRTDMQQSSSINTLSKKQRYLTRKSPEAPGKSEFVQYIDSCIPEKSENVSSLKESLPLESQVVQYVHTRQHQLSGKYNSRPILCFQFIHPSPKGEFLDIITSMGSTFDISPQYAENAATHLIVSEGPQVKNEKMIGFSVDAKWIVSEQFLLDSRKLGEWVDESEYEIHREGSFAKYLRRNPHRPFHGWRILLVVSAESYKSVKKMFHLGGAHDVLTKAEKKPHMNSITHIVYDVSSVATCHSREAQSDFYNHYHKVMLPSLFQLKDRIESKEILTVSWEYIIHLFCDYGDVFDPDRKDDASVSTIANVSKSLSPRTLEGYRKHADIRF